MNKIPTAEEFIKEYNNHEHSKSDECGCRWRDLVAMRKFAQLHVEAALKAAAESVDFTHETYASIQEGNIMEIDKESILNAYDKNLIK